MTEAARLWIIALIAAISVLEVDVTVVDSAALAVSFIGSVSVFWPSRGASS